MKRARSEATCRLDVSEENGDEDRLLNGDEMAEFAADFADHLGDDERVVDPVVFGDAGLGIVEIIFGLQRSTSVRDTYVAMFDIIHDAGEALGCTWRDDLERERSLRHLPMTARTLDYRSLQVAAVEPADG